MPKCVHLTWMDSNMIGFNYAKDSRQWNLSQMFSLLFHHRCIWMAIGREAGTSTTINSVKSFQKWQKNVALQMIKSLTCSMQWVERSSINHTCTATTDGVMAIIQSIWAMISWPKRFLKKSWISTLRTPRVERVNELDRVEEIKSRFWSYLKSIYDDINHPKKWLIINKNLLEI